MKGGEKNGQEKLPQKMLVLIEMNGVCWKLVFPVRIFLSGQEK